MCQYFFNFWIFFLLFVESCIHLCIRYHEQLHRIFILSASFFIVFLIVGTVSGCCDLGRLRVTIGVVWAVLFKCYVDQLIRPWTLWLYATIMFCLVLVSFFFTRSQYYYSFDFIWILYDLCLSYFRIYPCLFIYNLYVVTINMYCIFLMFLYCNF